MTKYFKVLADDLIHHGYKYKLGLNVDVLPFNPNDSCGPGGLYYTTEEHVLSYSEYGSLIAEVEPMGQTYKDPECDKWKTDKLFVKSIVPITTWLSAKSRKFQCSMVKKNPSNIRYIIDPAEGVQLVAVKLDGNSILYIKDPSEAVKLAAVKNKAELWYIKNPSEAVQLAMIKRDWQNIGYFENPSEVVQLAAVQQSPDGILNIKNPSEAVQLKAIDRYPGNIQYIKNPTESVQRKAIEKDSWTLMSIDNPSEEITQLAANRSRCMSAYVYMTRIDSFLRNTFKNMYNKKRSLA